MDVNSRKRGLHDLAFLRQASLDEPYVSCKCRPALNSSLLVKFNFPLSIAMRHSYLEVPAVGLLREIGSAMNAGIFPVVKNSGVVMPDNTGVPTILSGTEKERESRKQSQGSSAGSRQGAARREGPAGGSWAAGEASPLVRPSLQAYEEELVAVRLAYPGTQTWYQGGAVWLLTESRLLPGLARRAVFLTTVDPSQGAYRSWAFWRSEADEFRWIGPRHTNSPDGSVCAFDPMDQTWSTQDSLVTLLDIFSVWAVRHLHLELLGSWPGYQSVHQPHERVIEFQPGELCGCGDFSRRYADCCMSQDALISRISCAMRYNKEFGMRSPPGSIRKFLFNQSNPSILPSVFH